MSASSALDGESTHVYSREYAVSLDTQDTLKQTRDQFLIPSKAQLKAKSLPEVGKDTRTFLSFCQDSEEFHG